MTWKCAKCGREFSRQNQDHYCVKPQNIDDYIAAQDEKYQPVLREVRAVLRNALICRRAFRLECKQRNNTNSL